MTWYVWYTYTWYTLLIVCFNIKGEKIAGELWRKNQDLNQNYWSSVVFCPVCFLFQVQKIQLLRWPFKKSFEIGWINFYQICRQVTYKCPTSRLFFFLKHEGVICSHRYALQFVLPNVQLFQFIISNAGKLILKSDAAHWFLSMWSVAMFCSGKALYKV